MFNMYSYYYLIDIIMTTLTLRIDSDLKLELQEMAKNLGLSLNQLINLDLRDFRKKKELNIDLDNKVEFISSKEIKWSEEFIWTKLHQKGLDLLKNI